MYLRICGSFRSAKITWVHELQIRKLQKSMWSANWKSANCKKYMGRKYGNPQIAKFAEGPQLRMAGTTTLCRS